MLREGTGHDNGFGARHDGSEMVEVAATQQSGQLGNRTPWGGRKEEKEVSKRGKVGIGEVRE